MNFELFFQDIIKGNRRGLIPSLIKFPLRLLSYPYRAIISSRNWAYDHGWFKQYSAPLPLVISIGNITAGGTGKTPVTLLFAKELEKNAQIAIASRGYKSKAEHLETPTLVNNKTSAAVCGDEPCLLAQNLQNSFVLAGKNRLKASNMAADAGAHILILDDGMQHRQLARDIDIVVLDAKDPVGKGSFLPYGMLRDDPRSLSRAHLLVLNHVKDEEHFHEVKNRLSNYTTAPAIGVKMVVEGIYDFSGKKIDVRGKRVGVFCGIANPESFLQTVHELGAEVVDKIYFPDHHLDFCKLVSFARKSGAEMLLCSEKDKVKILSEAEFGLPIGWVKMKLEIVNGKVIWEDFIKSIKNRLDIRRIR